MTICNMSIEAGARAGMIAPDATTFAYLENTPRAPKGAAWDAALERWKKLPTDAGATFDRSVEIDAATLVPMVTYGTHPGMVAPDQRQRARAGRRGVREGTGLHGTQGRRADQQRAGEQRVRRQLHQRPPLGPAQRGARAARSQARPGREDAGGARVAERQDAPPRPKASTRSSWTPAPNGARAAARCASA